MVTRLKFILLIVSISCSNTESLHQPVNCSPASLAEYFSQNNLIEALDDDVINQLGQSNMPDAAGAMGNNKPAYFHVRFQMGILSLTNFALDRQSTIALEGAVKAIEYSFMHQNMKGDFDLVIPESLRDLGTPTEGDLVSGTSFFMASLGCALMAFEESEWFNQQPGFKGRITALETNIASAFSYLKSNADILKQVDAKAPNRLLFNAIAFYSVGKYFHDHQAMASGIEFATLALGAQQRQGYYLEGNGWDSSYQGVALENGFRLLSLLGEENPFTETLYNSLACGAEWEISRVLPSGEISTEGNTRVYDGGEKFLGEEKGIAVKSVVFALLAMHQYSGDSKYKAVAEKMIAYYG